MVQERKTTDFVMPASSGIVSGHIETSLRSSLGCGMGPSTFDQKLVSSSKRVLLHNIDFQAAENDSSFQLVSLRSKYTPLNRPVKTEPHLDTATHTSPLSACDTKDNTLINGHVQKIKVEAGDGIPKPARVLFPPENVQQDWQHERPMGVGVGLRNNNNNCYLNSVLQCLTYTAPLVNYLYGNDHTYSCKQAGFCMMCELQRHVRRCLEQPRIPNRDCTISPQSILGKIRMIAKHLSYGRQEDAHEFLRYVVEAMQKSCLTGYEKLDRFSKDTTVVNQIFGGYLRSQVMCLKCKERSNTYDPVLDVSLDIKNVSNLLKAFERFVQPETLDNENAYSCPRCKEKVAAQKRFTVHRPPNILTVQLKRFDYNRMTGGKVSRQVSFNERLNLRPFMSMNQGPPVLYQLYAVLVHVGHSAGSGHYYCNIRAPNKHWYTMNDSHVTPINIQRVLMSEAYLLFYSRIKPHGSHNDVKKPMIGPKLPPGHKLEGSNKPVPNLGGLKKDIGSPVVRKEVVKPTGLLQSPPSMSVSSVKSEENQKVQNTKPQPSALPSQRERVSFDIGKPKSASVQNSEKTPPRIVMHIKNGKVFFPSEGKEAAAAAAAVAKSVNGGEGKSLKSKLVPYVDDSSNSEEEEAQPKVAPALENHTASSAENGKPSASSGALQVPIFDKRLNATTVVPGAYKPLDTGSQPESYAGKGSTEMMAGAVNNNKASATTKFTSPLRRQVSDSLSVVTNSSTQHKVNATTSWHVLDQEAAISPSLASGSSNTSMNSTTDWCVTPGVENRTKPILPEAQCNGWTITPVKVNGHHQNGTTVKEEKGVLVSDHSMTNTSLSAASSPSSSHKELSITIKKQPHNGGWASEPKSSHSSGTEKSGDGVPTGDQASSNPLAASSKKAASSPTKSDAEASNAKSKLLNGHIEDDSDGQGDHREHKKRKKHKRDHEESGDNSSEDRAEGKESLVNGCGTVDFLARLKKKKKKKHKHRHDDREPLLSPSDSDTSWRGSKRSSSSDDPNSSKKQHKRDTKKGDRDNYVWVEKTKETMDKEKSVKREAPSQSWDHHVKGGYKRRFDSESTKTNTPAWDGKRSKSETVVADLKMMSSRGYGSQVSSWEGGRSNVDLNVDLDRRQERKRHWSDDYNEDIDRGKVKKYAKNSYNESNFGNHNGYGYGNPYQKVQDMRNMDRDRRMLGKYNDRMDRPYYSSASSSNHSSYSHSNYRDGGHRDNYHNNYGYSSSSYRDGGYRSSKHYRYH